MKYTHQDVDDIEDLEDILSCPLCPLCRLCPQILQKEIARASAQRQRSHPFRLLRASSERFLLLNATHMSS